MSLSTTDTKSPLESKTVWGSIIALIPVVDAGLAVTGILPHGVLNEGIGILLGAFGSLFAIYSRIRATKKVK